MSRRLLPLLLTALAAAFAVEAQDPPGELKQRQKTEQKSGGQPDMPPEEDTDVGNIEYSFNPLLAEKDVKVGNFYFKQGKYRAAEGRFRSATRWNAGNADAWLRLGEVSEKLKDPKAAREAYSKYLELNAGAKDAGEIRKRLEKLK
jgi:tetratricopeptide (TPR) repeat protein